MRTSATRHARAAKNAMGKAAAAVAPRISVFIRSSIKPPLLAAAGAHRADRRIVLAKNLCELGIARAVQFHHITHRHAREQVLDVAVAHAHTAVRSVSPDGTRLVRSVDPVALTAQPEPARTQWIVLARRDHFARSV